MIYLTLFLEFFKVGLFSVGGGLATIPFLSELATKYNWFDHNQLLVLLELTWQHLQDLRLLEYLEV